MPALIDLRRRIRSVRNTQQVTKAMKTVATAKFKKAQRRVLEARPWWHETPVQVRALVALAGRERHPLLERRPEKRVHVVVVTGDKGLCGAFNSNLLAEVQAFLEAKAESADIRLTLIGRKAVNYFRKKTFPVEAAYGERIDRFGDAEIGAIARDLVRRFVYHGADAVYVAYNEFKSILGPQIAVVPLLPIPLPPEAEGAAPPPAPAVEPGPGPMLRALLPAFVEDQLRHCFYESQAAEQAARMMAMDLATKNAEELVDTLHLQLNKIRQASITKELLEIMTAVDALAK
ncbi:MAG: ATP synthase F1 subunit gamma [Candidatus Aminicenantes bacterium]|nr:ATP synthase F1 subunit gamma [Candidatus Aminicenantes bacterium]